MTRVKSVTPKSKTRDVVAVYYAYGEIDNGSSYDEGINSEKVAKDLRDLRKDKNVKSGRASRELSGRKCLWFGTDLA